jgi:hypothetical protein
MRSFLLSILLFMQIINTGGNRKIFPPAAPPLNSCLVSAWAMNEGTGLTLHDSSTGGTNTAAINTGASVTWTANSIKSGVTSPVWNGSGDAIASSTTLTNFDGTTPFSISIWINPSNNSDATYIGTLNAPGNVYQGWELGLNFGINPVFYLINSYVGNNYLQVTGNSFSINPGNLYYVVVTYDGSRTASGVKIYVNGSVSNSYVDNDSLSASTANGLPVRFAARNDGSNEFSGGLAYAEVYNCVLSPSTVSTYNSQGPGIY